MTALNFTPNSSARALSSKKYNTIGTVPDTFFSAANVRTFMEGAPPEAIKYTMETFKKSIYFKQFQGLFMTFLLGSAIFMVVDFMFTYHLEKNVINKKFLEFTDMLIEEESINDGDTAVDDTIFNLKDKSDGDTNLLGVKKKVVQKDLIVTRKKYNRKFDLKEAQEEYKSARAQIFQIPAKYMKNITLQGQAKKVIDDQLEVERLKTVMDRKLLFRNISYINKDF